MSPDQMTPEALAGVAAQQIRAEMEQQPQPSPVLALLEESFMLRSIDAQRSQARGQALLALSARLNERAELGPEDEATAGQEEPMTPGRPHGGIIRHEPPPPGESAQAKAEAEQAAREAAQAEAAPDPEPAPARARKAT